MPSSGQPAGAHTMLAIQAPSPGPQPERPNQDRLDLVVSKA